MKKVILALFIVLGFSSAYGQIFQIGARAGVGRSDIRIDEELSLPNNSTIEVRPGPPQTSFHIGAYTRVKILGFYVQPELLYTNFGGEVDFRNPNTGLENDVMVDVHRLDIPVMLGFKLGPVRLNAGPALNLILYAEDNADEGDLNFTSSALGWQYGVGVDIGKFLIDLKAEGTWGGPLDGVSDDSSQYELSGNMHQVTLGIGYRIL